jgi:pyruvate kinase
MLSVPQSTFNELVALWDELTALQGHALGVERISEDEIALCDPARRAAARNLVDYLALRQRELVDLQRALRRHGFSSLGVVQGHVMASVDAVLAVVAQLCGRRHVPIEAPRYPSIEGARGQLRAFADETLGSSVAEHSVRIMVTMPSEAARDPSIADRLLEQGMTVMRVNCAHDGPAEWAAMLDHLRRAEQKHRRSCRISFDLAGPKLRTGLVEPGPEVRRFKPSRDRLGRVTALTTIRFGRADPHQTPDPALVPISRHLHAQAQAGDELRLRDSRGRERTLEVENAGSAVLLCKTDRTVYLTTDTEIELVRGGEVMQRGVVGRLPPVSSAIALQGGDTLVVTRDLRPGRAAVRDEADRVIEPARIGCSLPAVFEKVKPGDRVLLDDGKFEGVIRTTTADTFTVDITRGRGALKAEKGINLPDTCLDLPALTKKDLSDLEFIAPRADLVALSFVHSAADVDQCYAALDRLRAPDLGVILKIENRKAFEHLPELLMTASKRRRIAVMVARGDLGVEIGFERLAEIQEEILWLTEAAQVPVIWATQVLESLAKNGLPSRAEVTDAAMSARSECVMLNKGVHIDEAIRFLVDVSRRMSRHADKTMAVHRRLSVAASEWLATDRSAGASG